jgi:hypothetical protein
LFCFCNGMQLHYQVIDKRNIWRLLLRFLHCTMGICICGLGAVCQCYAEGGGDCYAKL